jgi:hypothetical protein
MTTYAIKVKSDPVVDVVEFDATKSYETIKEATGGGLFDCITLPSLGIDMWIDDEGKLVNDPQINAFGTALWLNEFDNPDLICGDIIITGMPDAEGNTTGMTKQQTVEVINKVNEVVKEVLQGIREMQL